MTTFESTLFSTIYANETTLMDTLGVDCYIYDEQENGYMLYPTTEGQYIGSIHPDFEGAGVHVCFYNQDNHFIGASDWTLSDIQEII